MPPTAQYFWCFRRFRCPDYLYLSLLITLTLSACDRRAQEQSQKQGQEQEQSQELGSVDSERALAQVGLTGADQPDRARETFEFFRGLMGTRFSIQLIGYDRHAARFAARSAFNEIDRIETLVSSWKPDSEIGRVNQRAGGELTEISLETAWLLCSSARVSRETSGVFDITWAALKGLWDFRRAVIPPHEQLLRRLRDVGISQLRILEASREPQALIAAHVTRQVNLPAACNHIDTTRPPPPPWSRFKSDPSRVPVEWSLRWRAGLSNPRARIDLGGIAKGFAVDQAARVLTRLGYHDFLIDGGGDLLVNGRALNESPWSVAIQHPRSDRAWGRAWIPPGWSVVTSGDYERYFIADRQRYHHIIDLRTGYPAQGNVAVTVFARSALLADAYATALFVLGPREGLAVAELTPQLEAVFFTPTGEVLTTAGADLFLHQTQRSWRE